MRLILKTYGFLIILALFSTIRAEILNLDLKTAREIALERNPSLKLAREGVHKASRHVIEARGNLLPTINAYSNLQHAWALQKNRIPNFLKAPFDSLFYNLYTTGLIPTFTPQPEYLEMAFGLENVLIAGIQLQQPIYLGGTIRNGYNISKLGYNIAQLQFKSIEQNVLNELTSSYYRVLFTKSTLTVFQEALQSAEQNLEQVNKFYNVGKASNFDLLRAEVQVANTKPFVASAKNNFRLSESGLRMIMGIDESIELNFVEELELYYSELTIKSLEELMEIALISRPEIQMLNDQKSITKKQVSLSKASFLPTVVFGTSYQYQGMRNDLKFNSEDFNKSFNSSISISIPLFSGMKNSAKYQQAKIAVKETEHQAESLINSIKLEVKSAYYTMQEALEKVQTQQKTIEQAKEAQRLAHLMYSEGSSTQLDILNADLAVQQAQMNYQQSLFEYNVALANLKKAINQL